MVFSKKVLTAALIVILLGLGGYYIVVKSGLLTKGEEAQDSSEAEQKPTESPLPVKVAPVERGDLIITLKSPGEAVTNMQVAMKAEVTGKIINMRIKESQHVKKGDILIELDDREHRLALDRNEADRLETLSKLLLEKRYAETPEGGSVDAEGRSALKEYDQLSELFQKGMISQEEYERRSRELEVTLIESGAKKDEIMEAAQGLTQAEIAVKQARLTLDKTRIRAPFSGIITNIQVSPGENVSAGMEMFTLVNISRVQVHAKVLESEIGKMKVGREVDLKFSAYPDQVFKGKVQAISPIVNAEEKTCNVIIDMVNVDEAIKPGMHAEVEIAAEIYPDRLLVPQDAILTRSGRKLVFVVEDERAKWKYVEVGLENEYFAEVLPTDDPGGGIEPGDQVLIDGHFTIAHDARVSIVK
jgi:RND family efflux transporter MFP subunit